MAVRVYGGMAYDITFARYLLFSIALLKKTVILTGEG